MEPLEGVQKYNPGSLPKNLAFAQAVSKDGWFYISGQVPVNEEGVTVSGGVEEQARQVFENLAAVLNEAGCKYENLIKVKAFLTRSEDYPAYDAIRRKYLPGAFFASTVIIVSGLAREEWLLEVEAVANFGCESICRSNSGR